MERLRQRVDEDRDRFEVWLSRSMQQIEKDRTHVWLQELRRMSAFELETAAARAEAEAADGEVMAGG